MALLTRYLHLTSPEETHVFNFVVTKSVTRDLSRDVVSKDFIFASHKWALSINHQEKNLGVSLIWRSSSEGVEVNVKAVVTLLNREFFGENRSFTLNRACFTKDNSRQGNLSFIKIADLLTHRPRFTDHNGEFQVELRLLNAGTIFTQEMLIQRNVSEDRDHFDSLETTSNEFTYGPFKWTLCLRPQPLLMPLPKTESKSSWAAPIQKALLQQRLNKEGGQDLDQLGLCATLQRRPHPLNNKMASKNGPDELLAKLSYKITFVMCAPTKNNKENLEEKHVSALINKEKLSSEAKEEFLSVGDFTAAFAPKIRLGDLYSKRLPSGGLLSSSRGGYVKLKVELISTYALTEFHLHPSLPDQSVAPPLLTNQPMNIEDLTQRQKRKQQLCREKSIVLMSNNNPIIGEDIENGLWQMECDLNSNFFRCAMMYQDVMKIPRNHLRFIQWRAFLVRRSRRWRGLRVDRENLENIEFQAGHSYRYYYVQDDSDTGTVMETSVLTKDIREGLSDFVEQDGSIRVRIQWELNYLLFQATFNQCDEVVRSHNIQMRTEITSLTEKIRSLEIAQVYQRKQQAIAIAALAAEKLKRRPHLNEFHSSDSNLAYDYSTSNNANENQNGTMNPGSNARRIQAPIGKRLLLKTLYSSEKSHLSLDSGMGLEPPKDSKLDSTTCPTTPLTTHISRRPPLSRTQSGTTVYVTKHPRPQRSASTKSMIESNQTPGTPISVAAAGKPPPPPHSRSVSPQPRIITSKPSVVEGQMSPPPRKLIFNNSKEEPTTRKTSPLATTSTTITNLSKSNSISPKIEKSDSIALGSEPKTPPAGGIMRLLQPLRNTLSVSADNLPIRPLSVAKIMGRRPSKCQSID